jgi:hypothetical protein
MASLIVSIIAVVVAVTSFVVTLVLTIRRDLGAIRPVLVFTYRQDGWHVENQGNGPALDVMFHRVSAESVTQTVRLPSLAKGGEILPHFARHDAKQIFVATYRDADGRPYSSRSRHDVSTSRKGFSIEPPSDPETLPRWWGLPDSDARAAQPGAAPDA